MDKREPPTGGARTSSLTEAELWGIIGGCIAFVIVVAIIILVCCICRKKSKNSGASKGKQSVFFLSIALTLGNLNYYLIIFDKAFWEGFDDDYFDLILCGSLDMTTERCTHFDLFKVASRTVKLMVIACKFTLFLYSVIALSGVVPVVICLVRYMYINTVVC